jgi:hypothetical protein
MTAIYDLAFIGELLMATVPHGTSAADIEAAVRDECSKARVEFAEPRIVEGVYLTNDVRDGDEIIHESPDRGWLWNEHGTTFKYAVRRN